MGNLFQSLNGGMESSEEKIGKEILLLPTHLSVLQALCVGSLRDPHKIKEPQKRFPEFLITIAGKKLTYQLIFNSCSCPGASMEGRALNSAWKKLVRSEG